MSLSDNAHSPVAKFTFFNVVQNTIIKMRKSNIINFALQYNTHLNV